MKLYALPGTCALAPNIAALWADAPIELVCLERGDQKGEDYLAINPKGQVPALVFEDGDVLTEATAILTYIGAAFGKNPEYAPDQPLGRKEAEALSYLSSEVHATFKCHFAPHLFANSNATERAVRHKAYKRLDKMFTQLNAQVGATDGPWLLAKKSYADAYLYIVMRWVEKTPLSLSDYPALDSHQKQMEVDPKVLEALARQNMTPAG
jgi:glutathione S-transferase